MEFADNGGGLGKGRCRALRRRREVGEGRVEHTVPMIFSADETADLGYEHQRQRRLHGRDQPLQRRDQAGADRRRLGRREVDHLIGPEERLHVVITLRLTREAGGYDPVSTDDWSIDPEESLNRKLTVPTPPPAPLTGQVTVVPGSTLTGSGQLTVALPMPFLARLCSSALSTEVPDSSTVPGLKL
jgi:hypothetical protein